jgi:tetratricopeptide (TPR) repeat protein
VNLEAWPAPETGWGPTLLRGLPGVAALAALALVGLRDMRPAGGAPAARDRTSAGPARAALRVRGLALCWGLLGSLPLFLPSIGWHAYYGLFGAFGVWLLVMHGLSRRPRLALALIGALAVLRPLRADTPSWDWASDAYQRRAGHFLGALRDDLLRQRPALPRHARLYFAQVPRNIGWVAGNGPALRVWYRDSTLVGGYYSYYRPRGAGEPAGPDYFFRFDSLGKWVEVVKGAEDVRAARERNPAWEPDHAELARLLGHAGDWAGAAAELGKLADAVPGDFQYPLNAAVCYERLGDSTAAARWYARAAALPGAGQEVRADARRLARWARP